MDNDNKIKEEITKSIAKRKAKAQLAKSSVSLLRY